MTSQPDAAKAMSVVTGYFDREDDRFVEGLREISYPTLLTPLVERWTKDIRPWARAQQFAYLSLPLNVPGHQVVVKRLYKQAEADRDNELVGAFLVAFDRLTRRTRTTRWTYEWDPTTRRSTSEKREVLVLATKALLPRGRFDAAKRKYVDQRGYQYYYGPQTKLRLFSAHTRQYLCRRAWRYFRRLGFRKPEDYVAAIFPALLRYTDDDLAQPEHLLDSWSLMQICFGKHPALDFTKPSVRLKPGRTLAELTAAPRFESLWSEAAAEPLPMPSGVAIRLLLLLEAPSRTVRIWAKQLLERHHRSLLDALPTETLFRLLDHDDPELQQFGASLLERLKGLDTWPLDTWLRLLELRDPTALAVVCELFARRVAGSRLDLAQTLQLATGRAVPVVRLGLQFLKARDWTSADDRHALAALGGAHCDAVAGELAKWALGLVGSGPRYDRDVALTLLDSLSEPMRAAALAWFGRSPEAADDPVLWIRLLESPYEETRLQLVELLQYRASRPRVDPRDLSGLWSSVLLGVHRGGRHKLKAVEQLAAAMIDKPECAERLVPVLGAAIRSIRGPEQRAGLAGAARVVARRPDLVELLRKELPELEFVAPPTTTSGAT